MKRAKLPCGFCGKTVAARVQVQTVGGKHRVPHKCTHDKPCLAGHQLAGQQGNNPGGFAHRLKCLDCALAAALNNGRHPEVGK